MGAIRYGQGMLPEWEREALRDTSEHENHIRVMKLGLKTFYRLQSRGVPGMRERILRQKEYISKLEREDPTEFARRRDKFWKEALGGEA